MNKALEQTQTKNKATKTETEPKLSMGQGTDESGHPDHTKRSYCPWIQCFMTSTSMSQKANVI